MFLKLKGLRPFSANALKDVDVILTQKILANAPVASQPNGSVWSVPASVSVIAAEGAVFVIMFPTLLESADAAISLSRLGEDCRSRR
jgi:hypothetical protein